jgi:hypothetical protein
MSRYDDLRRNGAKLSSQAKSAKPEAQNGTAKRASTMWLIAYRIRNVQE